MNDKSDGYNVLLQQLFDKKAVLSPVDETTIGIPKEQVDSLCEQSALLDLAEDMIILLDMDHNILFWNQGAEHKYGWSRDEIRGENIHSLLNTTFTHSIKEIEQSLAACGRWKGELVQILRNGSWILVQSQWIIKSNNEGKPVAILEINRDISQHKSADMMRHKDLENLNTLLEKTTVDVQKVKELLQEENIERKRVEEVLKRRERQLKIKAKNLEETKASLMALLSKKEEKKSELEEKILSDVKSMVLPYVGKFKKTALNRTQMNCMNIIETYLNRLTSTFLIRLRSQPFNMTQKEIEVACLIRDGKKTKEIAELMNICTGSVAFHRNSIRKKLGLSKKKINLASHLSSMANEQ